MVYQTPTKAYRSQIPIAFGIPGHVTTKRGDWKRETGKHGMVKTAGLENARLENAAPNCRTGKREKRHVWKAKLRTPYV